MAEACLARGDRVIVVDEMNDYYDIAIKEQNLEILKDMKKSLSIYIGNICDEAFISNVFEIEKPTHICHLGNIVFNFFIS